VGNIFIRNPEIARSILLPRVSQKCEELMQCREKFIKTCEEVAAKNFYKSLDYRCFYFAKNDKKFNCALRWEKEIEMRREQILQNKDIVAEEQIEDRESLQRGRYFYVNSFDNITKENFIENRQISSKLDRRLNAAYPSYPSNQILFILNFADESILNDVLEVILYYCPKKNVL
jgi:histone deacetylase complex regulatory component SIN3